MKRLLNISSNKPLPFKSMKNERTFFPFCVHKVLKTRKRSLQRIIDWGLKNELFSLKY